MRSLSIVLLLILILCWTAAGAQAGQRTLAITQVWQHKDTGMLCIPGADPTVHAWNHATVCVHCGTYCAPAACSMYALYFGAAPPNTNQDDIYDNAKLSGGEVLSNGSLETHGLGMYAGVGGTPPEIQAAFSYAVGMWPTQWGPGGGPFNMLNQMMVITLIDVNNPILWVDMGSWPADQENVPEEIYYDSGHCRVIAGYDDMGTADFMDDRYWIYDPWPNSGSPYWLGQAQVLDQVDVYLSIWDGISNEDSSWGAVKRLLGR